MASPDAATRTTLADLQDLKPELTALRRALHQQPELAFQEHATSARVAGLLAQWGYEVVTGLAGTGLVATLRAGSGGRRLGLRADMDALPIAETTGLAYASQAEGRMHACGHDGHMAMLLGAARHLARTRNFSGVLHLIFQPAEERGFDSGAKRMVEEGLFQRFPCDMVLAMHNHPGAPVGQFLSRSGPFMAAGDRVFVKLIGNGGHAARPHLATDPVVAAAAIVMALQTVVSRNIDPSQAAVVSVGRLRAGDALNVIPGEAEIGISVRSFSPQVRARLRERIVQICESTAESHEASVKIDYVEGYPVVDNADAPTALALAVARELVGDDRVTGDMPPLMGSEDFAYMQQAVPGALVRLGNGPASGGRALHNANYDFNDDNLCVGAAFWSRLAETYLRDAC
ncbi:amidohydrolase [Achromobacter xylosoxidans]|nr:amidohydrolase [Achromobacter xylosoxidans]